MDKDYADWVCEYCKKKKEILLLQGDKDAYINQLWKLVLEYDVGDLDLYKELKEQFLPYEWIIKREEIFKQLPKYARIERLYKEEKLYALLMDFVMKGNGLYALQEYENILKKDYSDQLLIKYEKEVNKLASYTSDRKKYRRLVFLLRKMQKIKDGSKTIEKICKHWRIIYSNRPAMMDELSKL